MRKLDTSDSLKYYLTNNEEGQILFSSSELVFPLFDQKYWDKDILLSTDTLKSVDVTHSIIVDTNTNRQSGIKPFFSLEQVDGVFALLLFCFLAITHIYKNGFIFFKENLPLVFSTRRNINQLSETTVSEFWYNFILIFQFVFLSAIILFTFFLSSDNSYEPSDSFLKIIVFILIIFLFGGFKYLLYKFIGYIFNIKDNITIWLRSYMIMLQILGITAFIPALFLVYSNYYHIALLIFLAVLFLISRLIIIYRISLFFLRKDVNFLFLIAYLCSVEIIPYILLYEGLLYLFKIDIISYYGF